MMRWLLCVLLAGCCVTVHTRSVRDDTPCTRRPDNVTRTLDHVSPHEGVLIWL